MIVLFAPFADRLNLNGDQGNLLVLQKYFEALRVDFRIVSSFVELGTTQPDFVFLGHGSEAAMASIDGELGSHAARLVEWRDTVPGLAVGSSVVWLVKAGLSMQVLTPGEQESHFEVVDLEGTKILGYRNTNSGLASAVADGEWIECMLHGPVLAKNPKLLVGMAQKILKSAQQEVGSSDVRDALVAKLNGICSQIWSLETEEVFEPAD